MTYTLTSQNILSSWDTLCIYVYIYIHIYMYIYIYKTHSCVYTSHTHTHTYIYIYIRIFQLYTHSSSAVLSLLHLIHFLVQFKKIFRNAVYIYIYNNVYIIEGRKWEDGEIGSSLEGNAHEFMMHQSLQVIGRTEENRENCQDKWDSN